MNNVPQEFLDLIPVQVESVEGVVDIDHLIVRDDGEFFGGAEPYLLLTHFQIDGQIAVIEATLDVQAILAGQSSLIVQMRPTPERNSFVSLTRGGAHGNVHEVNIGPAELASDGPKRVSLGYVYRRTIRPIPIRLHLNTGDVTVELEIPGGLPGFIGVHAVLMEEDFTDEDAIEAAHREVEEGIRSILEDVLSEIDLSDLSVDPSSFTERQAEIEDAAKQAAANQMDAWELFWGGIVDPDDQLIQVFSIANILQLEDPKSIEERYQGSNGDWLLVGEIRTR